MNLNPELLRLYHAGDGELYLSFVLSSVFPSVFSFISFLLSVFPLSYLCISFSPKDKLTIKDRL